MENESAETQPTGEEWNQHRAAVKTRKSQSKAIMTKARERPAGPVTAADTEEIRVRGSVRRTDPVQCMWCGEPIAVHPTTGRIPRYCGRSCRDMAYQQRRAVARGAVPAGESAIRQTVVVEIRPDVRPKPGEIRFRGPVLLGEFLSAVGGLAELVDSGRVYDRDMEGVSESVRGLVEAVNRRART